MGGLEWEEAAGLPPPESQVAPAGALRLITAAGLGGPAAQDAANIAAQEEEVAARAGALDRVMAQAAAWPGRGTPLLQWLAAPAPEGERRERAMAGALQAAAREVERQYRAFSAGPLSGLLRWLEEHGRATLGLGLEEGAALAGAMLDAAPPPPPCPRLAAVARHLLNGGPRAAPAPAEVMARLGGILEDLGLLEGAPLPVRFRLHRGTVPRGRCRVAGGVVEAAVELSGRYRDVVTVFHEAGHAAHFAHAGTKGSGTAGIVVAEGFAHLLGQLGRDPVAAGAWVEGCLDWAAQSRLAPRRVAAAKWQFALAAGRDPQGGLEHYAAGQSRALGAPFAPGFWLADDSGAHAWLVYLLCTCLAASLTAELRGLAGREWYRSRQAGAQIRRWMAEDARRPAEFLSRRLRGGVDLARGL